MAYGRSNPNDSRRINAINRALHRGDISSIPNAVKTWLSDSKKPKSQRASWMQRVTGKAAGKPGSGKWLSKHGKGLKKMSAKRRNSFARAKTEIAREFAKQAPGKYKASKGRWVGNKNKTTRSYVSRATGRKASRYINKKKTKTRTLSDGRNILVVSPEDVQVYDKMRATERWEFAGKSMPSNWRKTKSPGKRPKRAARKAAYKARRPKQTASKPKASGRGKKKRTYKKKAKANGLALRNGLALKNGVVQDLTGYLTGYALPLGIAAGAAGGLTAFAVSQGWTEKLTDFLPEQVAEKVPYSVQGLLGGTALALLAGGAWMKGMPQARNGLALTGGAVLALGFGMDAFNAASDYFEGSADVVADADFVDAAGTEELAGLAFGDLALQNWGGLALDNMSALGDLGDGMAYQTAPLTAQSPMSADYGQTTFGDAYYSGPDFSGPEGQALLNGQQAFYNAFGNPPHRASAHVSGGASHLAGRPGHRWGWLIRTVGWEKARAICAMPANQRVQVLAAMRKAALRAYQNQTAITQAADAQAAPPSPELVAVSGTVAQGPMGPGGAQASYLGDPALIMG